MLKPVGQVEVLFYDAELQLVLLKRLSGPSVLAGGMVIAAQDDSHWARIVVRAMGSLHPDPDVSPYGVDHAGLRGEFTEGTVLDVLAEE